MDMTTIFSSLGLTALMLLVAFYYYRQGKNVGMLEAMLIIKEHDPKAFKRLHDKLKKESNET